ncbi:hypothetical protein SAMN05192574_101843 [Mucilaginibacter gossypiicola]|uniref:Uncharacterized protein n=1 Tax=Mucilaginibacter gossypiicola TaxID=551995 RepID=A0A1H8BD38_9SPHI|nr:hypothetical protein [Mucilaginibacter gossypiicola]SEM79757.1 hypothetical protein SAMN05192574_101843 [Mucilaginibacter gossypiicola]
MKKDLPADLIERFFLGECTDKENEDILLWYNSFQNSAVDLDCMSTVERGLFKAIMWAEITKKTGGFS